jgi:hypothetical integral membrane protein (TIGR02206 family)
MDARHAPLVTPTFEPFGAAWWQTSGATVAVAALLLYAVRFLGLPQRALYARSLGLALLLWVVLPPLAHALAGQWELHLGLPLHWCDLTSAIAGIAVLTRRQLLYEFSLYWGITGAASALMTPQFTLGAQWFYVAEFFVSHFLLLTAPMFLTLYEDMRPRRGSWLSALAWLNAAALPVLAFDLATDANYMFLLRAPTIDLPFYRIEWPYYLIAFEIAALLAFALIELPFRLLRPATNSAANAARRGEVRP